jgi:hypothetical protein
MARVVKAWERPVDVGADDGTLECAGGRERGERGPEFVPEHERSVRRAPGREPMPTQAGDVLWG